MGQRSRGSVNDKREVHGLDLFDASSGSDRYAPHFALQLNFRSWLRQFRA